MRKIPTLFVRDFRGVIPVITSKVHPDCQWVVDGEGVATEKYDGSCCMLRGGFLYRRHSCKVGRIPPDGWVPAQPEPTEQGDWPGWVLVDFKNSSDKWHFDALATLVANGIVLGDGTYELVGPRINGNPYGLTTHMLWRHGGDVLSSCPRSFTALMGWLRELPMEGVVWHHEDGRMAKLKRRDFGYEWPKIRGSQ